MGILGFLKKLFGMGGADKNLICVDCRGGFVFEPGEQAFFAERGLSEPKRCPGCRKQSRGRRGRSWRKKQ